MTSAPQSYRFPVLIADIGGTNARFAVLPDAAAAAVIFPTIEAADFAGPVEAIRSLGLEARGLHPRSAVMAIAGPVVGDEIRLTNSPWRIAPREMIAALALQTVAVLNDFEALALALPAFGPEDLEQIGGGTALPHGAMAVIGPGTGLGVAGMVHAAGLWVPVPGEGGHVALGPETADEFRIWPHLQGFGAHVEAEHLVCGRGLVHLAAALAAADGLPALYATPADVTRAADAGAPLAIKAAEMFAALLGRLAGDMALTFLARGGVFIAGGVSARVARFLSGGAFRAGFENKDPHRALVASMPTWLIRHDLPALVGLAAYARAPAIYALDLSGRCWTT